MYYLGEAIFTDFLLCISLLLSPLFMVGWLELTLLLFKEFLYLAIISLSSLLLSITAFSLASPAETLTWLFPSFEYYECLNGPRPSAWIPCGLMTLSNLLPLSWWMLSLKNEVLIWKIITYAMSLMSEFIIWLPPLWLLLVSILRLRVFWLTVLNFERSIPFFPFYFETSGR